MTVKCMIVASLLWLILSSKLQQTSAWVINRIYHQISIRLLQCQSGLRRGFTVDIRTLIWEVIIRRMPLRLRGGESIDCNSSSPQASPHHKALSHHYHFFPSHYLTWHNNTLYFCSALQHSPKSMCLLFNLWWKRWKRYSVGQVRQELLKHVVFKASSKWPLDR